MVYCEHKETIWERTMKNIRESITKIIPEYSLIPVIFAFVFNSAVYAGSKMIAGNWHHYNIETKVDQMIPFLPQSILIYLGCYIFWIVNYILIARQDKKSAYAFFAGDIFSRCICFAFYLLLPTTNTRPVITGTGFFDQAMTWLYTIDTADNLFPSIHCLVSWFCYIGIRDRKEIPLWYRRVSCFLAVLVFISTLTTKQHVIVDVFAGVLLAEICFRIGKHTGIAAVYTFLMDKVNAFVFGGKEKAEDAD